MKINISNILQLLPISEWNNETIWALIELFFCFCQRNIVFSKLLRYRETAILIQLRIFDWKTEMWPGFEENEENLLIWHLQVFSADHKLCWLWINNRLSSSDSSFSEIKNCDFHWIFHTFDNKFPHCMNMTNFEMKKYVHTTRTKSIHCIACNLNLGKI